MKKFLLASFATVILAVGVLADISGRLNICTPDQTVSNWPYQLKVTPDAALTDNGDGTMTLSAGGGSGSPGGSPSDVQYNSAGSFGGTGNFTTDGNVVTLTQLVAISSVNFSSNTFAGGTTFYQNGPFLFPSTMTVSGPITGSTITASTNGVSLIVGSGANTSAWGCYAQTGSACRAAFGYSGANAYISGSTGKGVTFGTNQTSPGVGGTVGGSISLAGNWNLGGAAVMTNGVDVTTNIVVDAGYTTTLSSNVYLLNGTTIYNNGPAVFASSVAINSVSDPTVGLTVGTNVKFQANAYGNVLCNMSTCNNGQVSLSGGAQITRNTADATPAAIIKTSNASSTGDLLDLQNSAATPVSVAQNGYATFGSSLAIVNAAPSSSPYSLWVGTGTKTGNYHIAISTYGHITSGTAGTGNAPVLTSCGSGSPTITGTDMWGYVTPGTAATGCIITFAFPYKSRPACVVSPETLSLTNALSYTVSTTAITVTQTSLTEVFDYHCAGINE